MNEHQERPQVVVLYAFVCACIAAGFAVGLVAYRAAEVCQ